MLHRNCSCSCELNVRLLDNPNWTFITQVMVHFPGLPQTALFLTPYTVQILGLIFGWINKAIWTSVLHGNYSCIYKLDVAF